MKLRVENGRVPCLMVTGKDVVSTSLDKDFALQLVERADTVETTDTHKGFPLFVNGLYYLPEVTEPETDPALVAEGTPKADPKPRRKR